MFSYRHAFHAGNHADVLKHMVLLAVLKHMALKETAFTVLDTHAGASLYRLDGDYAQTSAEASQGFLKLVASAPAQPWAPLVQDYIDMVASFNAPGQWKVYPGSPFIAQPHLRGRDKLKLFELHPTDSKTLTANVAQLEAGRQIAIAREDGFETVKKFLPPPSRRAAPRPRFWFYSATTLAGRTSATTTGQPSRPTSARGPRRRARSRCRTFTLGARCAPPRAPRS
jgi:23S rRNA (adenine2030-N6)-methyltransferase